MKKGDIRYVVEDRYIIKKVTLQSLDSYQAYVSYEKWSFKEDVYPKHPESCLTKRQAIKRVREALKEGMQEWQRLQIRVEEMIAKL